MDVKNDNSAEEILKEKNTAEVLTKGGSMKPMLRQHKDIAVVKKVEKPIKKYDVILYKKSGINELVLHRVIKVTPDGYITRGDNCFYKECVKNEDIVAILDVFYRDGIYINCKQSKKYRLYILLNYYSYPLRYLWNKIKKTVR